VPRNYGHLTGEQVEPAAWGAAMDLVGGESRVRLPWQWGDGFIANLGVGDDRPWQPPSPTVGGWHKDGDFFRHFLDSAEQALLTFVLWTDMLHMGGGTFVAADSASRTRRWHCASRWTSAGRTRMTFSLVEQAVLRGLGVDRLDFVPAAPRENVVPERIRRQQARAIAENERLAAGKRTT